MVLNEGTRSLVSVECDFRHTYDAYVLLLLAYGWHKMNPVSPDAFSLEDFSLPPAHTISNGNGEELVSTAKSIPISTASPLPISSTSSAPISPISPISPRSGSAFSHSSNGQEARILRVRRILETHKFNDGVFSLTGHPDVPISELVHRIPYDAHGLIAAKEEDAIFVREKIMSLEWRNSYLLALWAVRASQSKDPADCERFMFYLGDWEYANDFSSKTNDAVIEALVLSAPLSWKEKCLANTGAARVSYHLVMRQGDVESALAIASMAAASGYSWLLAEFTEELSTGRIRRIRLSRAVQAIRDLGGRKDAIERALPYILAL